MVVSYNKGNSPKRTKHFNNVVYRPGGGKFGIFDNVILKIRRIKFITKKN